MAFVINAIRKKITEMVTNARSDAVKALCREMLVHPVNGLNTYWGSGETDTLFDENNALGRGNRQKGFPTNTLLAQALDPRSKNLRTIGAGDKIKIWGEIKRRMRIIFEEEKGPVEQIVNIDLDDEIDVVVPVRNPISELFRGIGGRVTTRTRVSMISHGTTQLM